MDFQTVARLGEVPPGRGTFVLVAGQPVALFNVGGRFVALDSACPHRGGPLAEGELDGTVVTCPLHGWTFDVLTGRHTLNPGVAVRRYEVRVEGDEVQVAVPEMLRVA